MSTSASDYNRIKALAFDAYGTLFDVHSVIALGEQLFPGQGTALSNTWRLKQLQYTWVRSLMGHYVDFWKVTEDGLVFAAKSLKLDLDSGKRKQLMEAYLSLATFPDVLPGLEQLAAAGYTLAILSNGAPPMLQAVAKSTGVDRFISEIISVDEIQIYKPSPRVYALAPKKLGTTTPATGFVSSNSWDVTGAASFGLTTFWINRGNQPADELGFAADQEIRKLTDLLPLLKAR
ncbi:MAG TPA: haloacid dehalogenase type II [Myxococcaceae bacterium]|nr:haloacid dehalogenase type II [Myxococcaceae bacterium]